jgi:hypothetical protein
MVIQRQKEAPKPVYDVRFLFAYGRFSTNLCRLSTFPGNANLFHPAG